MQEPTAAPQQPATNITSLGQRPALPDQRIDMFSERGFVLAQRIAKMYATSDAVPACFRDVISKREKQGNEYVDVLVENPNALGNCLVAIETAQAVGMSITAVMQNANIIEGKLSWSAQFVIAAVNASHRFSPLRFQMKNLGRKKVKYNEKGTWNKENKRYNMIEREAEIDDLECIAWAIPVGVPFPPNVVTLEQAKAAGLPVIEGAPVSMTMAVEEGWYGKAGSKWQTSMKHLMLQYRAGAFFGRIHAPDVVMGMGRTSEEAEDLIDVNPPPAAATATPVEELRTGRRASDVQDVEAKPVETPAGETQPQQSATPAAEAAAEPAKNETHAQQTATAVQDAAPTDQAAKNAAAVDAALGVQPKQPRTSRAKTGSSTAE